MSLSGRLVSSVDVKANGDVFHEIFAYKPHHIASTFPDIVQSVVLLGGSKKVAKAIIEAVDSNKKSITYKVIEGDLMQLYRKFDVIIHVDSHGGKNMVTWILGYVKLAPNIPDPNSLMDMFVTLTKGIKSRQYPN